MNVIFAIQTVSTAWLLGHLSAGMVAAQYHVKLDKEGIAKTF